MAVLLTSSVVLGQSAEATAGDASASIGDFDPGSSALSLRALPRQREVTAGALVFNNLEEAAFAEAGSRQLEQTFDTAHRTKSDKGFTSYYGATSVYWAPTERFQVGFTFAELRYESDDEREWLRYEGTGAIVLYSLVNPEAAPVGVAVFSRIVGNERGLSNDSRLALQVLRGPWNIAYNLRLGTDFAGFDGGSKETTGTLGHSVGVAHLWEIQGTISELSVGGEVLVDSTYAEWKNYQETTVYGGPTVGIVIGERWSVTVTGTVQLTDQDAPRFGTQVTVGWVF